MKPRADKLSAFRRRLVAEAVRFGEDRAGKARQHEEAEAAGRRTGSQLEDRVIARAMALPEAPAMAQAIDRQWRVFRWLVVLAMIIALLAGITSARLALGGDGAVNILWALGALLGLQLLMLAVWLAVMLIPAPKDGVSGGSLMGRGLMSASRWLNRRTGGSDGVTRPVMQAVRGVLGEGNLGRWLLGAVGHGIWFSYTLGALLACLLLLAIHQYDFHWATTIVPDAVMMSLLGELGRLPGWLGIPVPDAELVRASRLGTADGAGRVRWSGLLLGTLLVFGLLPRGILGLLCFWRARRAVRRFRLDLTRPGYARLAPRLQPVATLMGRQGTPPPESSVEPPPARPLNIDGPIAVVGIELERSGGDWPPAIEGLDWIVLGRADSRHDCRDILAVLDSLPQPPGCLVALVSLLRTPDRGTGAFLERLKDAVSPSPILLVLDEGELFDGRGGDSETRIAAWRTLGALAKVDAVEVLDLDRAGDREKLKHRLTSTDERK